MPVLHTFEFKKADAQITQRLTATEIAKIVTVQKSTAYYFEFHSGHTTGYPIYVRPKGNSDKSNLPKFDTKNKSATDYKKYTDLANGQKLSGLGQTVQTEIENIIKNNWKILQTFAQRYWDGEDAPQAAQVAQTYTCGKCDKKYDYTPPGVAVYNKYTCTKCGKREVKAD